MADMYAAECDGLRRRVEALEDGGVPMIGLRDYLAAQALIAQGTWWPNDENGRQPHGHTAIRKAKAEYAYAMADAMLEARKR